MNTVFNNKAPLLSSATSDTATSTAIEHLPLALQDSAKTGVVYAFISIIPFMWLCVLAASTLGNVRIEKDSVANAENRDFSGSAQESSYLLGLVRWRKKDENSGVIGREKVVEVQKEGAGDVLNVV